MWFLDFITKSIIWNELRSVIEWKNPQPETLVYKFSERGDEIKNASKLILNPGQWVVLVYGGKEQSVHLDPGTYDLATENIPFITTLTKVMQAFESEYKVGIYFFKTTIINNQKWGTKSPVKYIDPVYKFPVGMRAFGNFSFRITDFHNLFQTYLWARDSVTVAEICETISSRIIEPMTDIFAEAGIGYNDIDKNRSELSQKVRESAKDDFVPFGLELVDFRIENTDFDTETQDRISLIANTQANTIAAQTAWVSFSELQKLWALRDAANNSSGWTAQMFVWVNAGQALGQTLGSETESVESRILKAKRLLEQGLINEAEFDKKKSEILAQI